MRIKTMRSLSLVPNCALVRWLALLMLIDLSSSALAAQNAPSAPPGPDTQKCSALAALNLEAAPGGPAAITSARVVDVPASGLEVYRGGGLSGFGSIAISHTSRIRHYCDITGYVAPQNKFELKLPLPDDWNQKFLFAACGGFCGSVDGTRGNLALARGYASVTGNGGHDGGPVFDGVWAANAPELQEDFGWRSNHVVTLIAKAIITHYYSKPIKYSYVIGGSKGGQAALVEAQRFPGDFDGLLPFAPVIDYTGRCTISAAWFAQAVSDGHGGSVLNAAAAQAVHKSVLEHCGAQPGVEVGLVTDPPSCKWQPEMIACASGSSDPDCLSERQVAAIKRLMAPATNSKGEVLWAYPYVPGTETQWEGFNYPGAPRPGAPARFFDMLMPGQYLKYLVDEKMRAKGDALSFDFDRDPATLGRARRIYDATSLDLRAFKARGGKILLWHGWADGGIMANSSIGYYEGVLKFMGGREQTENFFRLFLVPGVHHTGGGPGLTEFDAFAALENWVEKGQAPEKLIACRSTNGVTERCLPVFPYPVLAHYSGKGDPKQADSFVPFDPTFGAEREHSAPQLASGTTQSPTAPYPLILQETDGEHRVGRPPFGHVQFTVKVDQQNGNAQDFSVLTETMAPGDAIPFHMHHNAEEVLILEDGGATVTVGDKRAVAGPRSIVFIPRETWVSVAITGTKPVHLYALFSRQGFEQRVRATTVVEGQPATPISADERRQLAGMGHATYWDTSKGPSPTVSEIAQSPGSPKALILQEGDGEHLVRRFLSHLPFTIKVDEQFGNAQDFFVLTEILAPGTTIPFHMHHNAEEILILEEGGATVTVGDKRAVAGPRSIVFIPQETWVSVTNSGTLSIHLYALFSRQGFERYLREASVPEGQPVTPLSPDDLARLRATGHAVFWDTSKGPYPPGVPHP
jgi:mannose-6-phosphate isomerase-like protein (cupin superfamily)